MSHPPAFGRRPERVLRPDVPELLVDDGLIDTASGLTAASGAYGLRRDGLLSLDAGSHRGTLVTRPLRWPSADAAGDDPWLAVNAQVRNGGSLMVRVLDRHGAAWPGLARQGIDASDPIGGDAVLQPVTWHGRRGTGRLGVAGRTVRLRFDLRQAALFSFSVCSGNGAGPMSALRSADVRR